MYKRVWVVMVVGIFISGCIGKVVINESEKEYEVMHGEKIPLDVYKDVEIGSEWVSINELKNINFDFDKYDIKKGVSEKLFLNSMFLNFNKKFEILIEGHCDERGTTEYNLALGQMRANAVKQHYKFMGIEESRISTISYGREKPLDFGSNEGAWATNRRVETKVRRK